MEIRRRGVCPFGRQRHTPCRRDAAHRRPEGLPPPVLLRQVERTGQPHLAQRDRQPWTP